MINPEVENEKYDVRERKIAHAYIEGNTISLCGVKSNTHVFEDNTRQDSEKCLTCLQKWQSKYGS